MAVAIFVDRPSADTLLEARLERGWRPTPTSLRDGPRVLGFAACVVTTDHR